MKKKVLSILMALVLITGIISLAAVNSVALTCGDYEYTVENGEATITKYNGSEQYLCIPSEFDEYPVTEVGYQAFYENSDIVFVGIPESIRNIGDEAFAACLSLALVIIPNSDTEISENAFEYCNTPNFYARYGSAAAEYAKNNGCYYQYISNSPEGFLYTLNSTDNTATVNGKLFGYNPCEPVSFYGYNISSVNVPSFVDSFNVSGIGDYAFRGRSWFGSITIPYGVNSIGSYAFAGCGLEEFTIPDSVEIIRPHAFYNCANLKSITIPHSVKEIQYDAFFYCPSLERVKLEEGVEELPTSASLFSECSSLKSVIIPRSVKTFGGDVFGSGNNSLVDILLYKDSSFDKFYKNNTAYKDKLRYFGDLNSDKEITREDYTDVASYLSGAQSNWSETQSTVADYNMDGAVDAFDLFEIDKAVNGI